MYFFWFAAIELVNPSLYGHVVILSPKAPATRLHGRSPALWPELDVNYRCHIIYYSMKVIYCYSRGLRDLLEIVTLYLNGDAVSVIFPF